MQKGILVLKYFPQDEENFYKAFLQYSFKTFIFEII